MSDDSPLLVRAAQVSERALASGALQPAHTRSERIEEAGIRFLVHVLLSDWGKTGGIFNPPSSSAGGKSGMHAENHIARTEVLETHGPVSPFLPYDRDLFVTTLPTGHICLLNKYNVLKNHLLLVTSEFVEQETPLEQADFVALWLCLAEFDGLAFYNSGETAGASQRHKHLQVAPLPIDHYTPSPPIEAALADLHGQEEIDVVHSLPFVHAVARLTLDWRANAETGAAILFHLYRALLDAIGCSLATGRPAPYNLLLTRRWMMATPRTRSSYFGIPVNALGYAGSLLARNEEQLKFLRKVGPLSVLRRVGVTRNAQ